MRGHLGQQAGQPGLLREHNIVRRQLADACGRGRVALGRGPEPAHEHLLALRGEVGEQSLHAPQQLRGRGLLRRGGFREVAEVGVTERHQRRARRRITLEHPAHERREPALGKFRVIADRGPVVAQRREIEGRQLEERDALVARPALAGDLVGVARRAGLREILHPHLPAVLDRLMARGARGRGDGGEARLGEMLLPVRAVVELQARPALVRVGGELRMVPAEAVELLLVAGLALAAAHFLQVEVAPMVFRVARGAGQLGRLARGQRTGHRENRRAGPIGRALGGELGQFGQVLAVRCRGLGPEHVALEAQLVLGVRMRRHARGGQRRQVGLGVAVGAALRGGGVLARDRAGAVPFRAVAAAEDEDRAAQRGEDGQPRQPTAVAAQAALRPARRHGTAALAVRHRARGAGAAEGNLARANPAVALARGLALARRAAFAFLTRSVDAGAALGGPAARPFVLRPLVEVAVVDEALEQAAQHGDRAAGFTSGRCSAWPASRGPG